MGGGGRARAALVAALLTTAAPLGALGLSPQELRGKQIFHQGVSPSGASISAWFGLARMSRTGDFMTCATCHGPDARGRPDRTPPAPDVTWRHLARGEGHVHPAGRSHPAFTEEDFATALGEGVDPAGNRFDPAMPRYSMVQGDIEDLVAYLKRIELDLDPGLSPDAVRMGAFLPLEGPLAPLGTVMAGVLQAYFAQVNEQGGVLGRRLELVTADAGGEPEERIERLRGLLDGDVFALVSPFTAGIETQAARLAEQKGVPSVGPFTQFPESGYVVNRTTFYLFGGTQEQARALVEVAAHLGLASPRIGVVTTAHGGPSEAAAEAVTRQAGRRGWEAVSIPLPVPRRWDPEEAARGLQDTGVEAVVFLGSSQDLLGFLAALRQIDWWPFLLLPASLAGDELLAADQRLDRRIFLALPTLPGAGSEAEREAFERLRGGDGTSEAHVAAQSSAYTAARLLVEGLRRAGEDLDRERLVESLEGISDFSPGLTPPLSYHPNRRIGALGAYIVSLDLEGRSFVPVGGWMALEKSR